jgi:serine/threonine protein kinase
LFSLGVVLFEAVVGCRPFDGVHNVETMQKILSGDRLSLEEVAPRVPGPLREIIERLVEVDREARTPSASRLIEELAAVAPRPEVRRELAATVEGHRGGPGARLHVRAREEERDTELGRVPGLHLDSVATESAEPQKTKPRSKSRALILSAAPATSLAALVAGTQWLGSGAEPVSVPEPASEPEPAPRPFKGWLNVVVQPWGNVWIDGNRMGRAPVKARLSKGRHVVEAGRKRPIQTRVVRVLAGTRKEIEFTLPD